MKTIEKVNTEHVGLNKKILSRIASKYEVINQLIRDGKDINPELNKNFVTFPISNNTIKE